MHGWHPSEARAGTQCGLVCRRDVGGARSASVRGVMRQWGP